MQVAGEAEDKTLLAVKMLEEMGFAGCGREALCETLLKAEAGNWSSRGTSQYVQASCYIGFLLRGASSVPWNFWQHDSNTSKALDGDGPCLGPRAVTGRRPQRAESSASICTGHAESIATIRGGMQERADNCTLCEGFLRMRCLGGHRRCPLHRLGWHASSPSLASSCCFFSEVPPAPLVLSQALPMQAFNFPSAEVEENCSSI